MRGRGRGLLFANRSLHLQQSNVTGLSLSPPFAAISENYSNEEEAWDWGWDWDWEIELWSARKAGGDRDRAGDWSTGGI